MEPGRKQIESCVLDSNERMKTVFTHQAITFGYMAAFAQDLIKGGSFMPCIPTGEKDKNGMPIYRLQTPEEIVTRSVEITEVAFKAFAERNWSCEHPPLADIIEVGAQVGFATQNKERA